MLEGAWALHAFSHLPPDFFQDPVLSLSFQIQCLLQSSPNSLHFHSPPSALTTYIGSCFQQTLLVVVDSGEKLPHKICISSSDILRLNREQENLPLTRAPSFQFMYFKDLAWEFRAWVLSSALHNKLIHFHCLRAALGLWQNRKSTQQQPLTLRHLICCHLEMASLYKHSCPFQLRPSSRLILCQVRTLQSPLGWFPRRDNMSCSSGTLVYRPAHMAHTAMSSGHSFVFFLLHLN